MTGLVSGERLSMAMPSCGLVQMQNEGGLWCSEITPSQMANGQCMSNLEGIGEMGIMRPKAEASWRGAVNVTFTS